MKRKPGTGKIIFWSIMFFLALFLLLGCICGKDYMFTAMLISIIGAIGFGLSYKRKLNRQAAQASCEPITAPETYKANSVPAPEQFEISLKDGQVKGWANMTRMMKCKTCGTEIAKSAKACPNCGAKQHQGVGCLIVLIIVLAIILAVATSSKSEQPSKVGNTNISENPKSAQISSAPSVSVQDEASYFTVGDKVKLNDITVTLLAVNENKGSSFYAPGDGNIFVLFQFEIENGSSSDIGISSLLSFEAYFDDYSTPMSLTATLSGGGTQLDGTVAAGKKIKGVIGYEVSADWSDAEIRFTPNFWSGNDIIFTYDK